MLQSKETIAGETVLVNVEIIQTIQGVAGRLTQALEDGGASGGGVSTGKK